MKKNTKKAPALRVLSDAELQAVVGAGPIAGAIGRNPIIWPGLPKV